MRKKFSRFVFHRRVFVVFTLLIQVVFFIFLIAGTSIYFHYANWVLNAVSLCVCVYILNKHTKAAYKITWIFLIMLFPIFGGLLYILFHSLSTPRKFGNLLEKNILESRDAMYLCGDRLPEFLRANPQFQPQAFYLQEYAGFPVYSSTRAVYFDSGETFFNRVLEELGKAERYIFLEFFILREGMMLDQIVSILERKAALGLDVRIIYDDLGCFMTQPDNYKQIMAEKGIKCYVFNPFRPMLSSLYNNRDHRKIISIDGRVAFTGGMNLADEYINAVERFGHWKDAAVMLEGEGAWPLTLIFLQMWNTSFPAENGSSAGNTQTAADRYSSYFPWKEKPCEIISDGFV